MRIVQITLAACMGTLAIASAASAGTIATFADPAASSATPLFTFTQVTPAAGTGSLAGGWSGLGLTLQTPGLPSVPDFTDAQFSMASVATIGTFFPFYFLGSGSINFFSSVATGSTPLMTISFGNAIITTNIGFGASDFQSYNVTFSGPIFADYTNIANESFSFSFANRLAVPSPALAGSYTVTSSFTSSGDLTVPAPGTIVLLGIGGLIVARRRR